MNRARVPFDCSPLAGTIARFALGRAGVVDDEPLLFHTGPRSAFGLVRQAIEHVMPIDRLRYVAYSHAECDENGALDELLAAAPDATPLSGAIGAMIAFDGSPRRPRVLADGETLTTGRKRLVWLDTPHLPHGWDAGMCSQRASRCGPRWATCRVRSTPSASSTASPATNPPWTLDRAPIEDREVDTRPCDGRSMKRRSRPPSPAWWAAALLLPACIAVDEPNQRGVNEDGALPDAGEDTTGEPPTDEACRPDVEHSAYHFVDYETYPYLDEVELGRLVLDVECEVLSFSYGGLDEEPDNPQEGHRLVARCPDRSGALHTLRFDFITAPVLAPSFDEGEAILVEHVGVLGDWDKFFWTSIRRIDGELALVAFTAHRLDPLGSVIDTHPVTFSLVDGVCPPEPTDCGTAEERAIEVAIDDGPSTRVPAFARVELAGGYTFQTGRNRVYDVPTDCGYSDGGALEHVDGLLVGNQ